MYANERRAEELKGASIEKSRRVKRKDKEQG